MKKLSVYPIVLALLLPATAVIAQQKMDDMKGMDMNKAPAATAQSTHKAVATVKNVDPSEGTVTLAHEPVKSLNWPAMTMGFKVADKKLLDKLSKGSKVEVEFMQVDKDYVLTSVK